MGSSTKSSGCSSVVSRDCHEGSGESHSCQVEGVGAPGESDGVNPVSKDCPPCDWEVSLRLPL
jgi:hypothetical protein